MHLEGALSPHLLFQLAEKNQIKLPQDDAAFQSPESLLERYQRSASYPDIHRLKTLNPLPLLTDFRFTSLDDFLHYYYIGMSVLITQSDFTALAWDYFLHASSDGVHHCELFFDPQAHLSRSISYSTVLAGFQAACTRASKELGITSILTACYLRHLPVPDCLSTFALAEVQESYASKLVRGIGLDSSELDGVYKG